MPQGLIALATLRLIGSAASTRHYGSPHAEAAGSTSLRISITQPRETENGRKSFALRRLQWIKLRLSALQDAAFASWR
jgi:hypothetical protein